MPKISVIVPVYKVERYLNRCVDSILKQTYTDFELILVDDGSPDNCGKICDEYATKDNRIIVIHKENGGLSDARNKGLDWSFMNSDSEWVTFIDSDDWLHERYLELLYHMAINNHTLITVCGYLKTEKEEKPSIDFSEEIVEVNKLWTEKRTNAVIAVCKLYNKSLWKNVRFPIGRIHEDEFTIFKLLFQVDSIVFVRGPLYFYYVNSEGITKSAYTVKKTDYVLAVEEQWEFFDRTKRVDLAIQTSRILLYGFISHISKLKEIGEDKKAKDLKKRGRDFIKKIKTRYSFPVISNVYFYKRFYPVRTKILYPVLLVFTKMKQDGFLKTIKSIFKRIFKRK